MVYDSRGNWQPPAEASAWQSSDSLLAALRQRGELTDRDLLQDLFDAGQDKWEQQDWEGQLNEQQRFEILDLYRQDYEAGRGFQDDWGIQFEREKGGSDLNLRDMHSAQERYRALLGDGYDIDYAHYNRNLAYRSTVDKLGKAFGFEDLRTDFSTPRQIMAAKAVLEQSGYDWDEAWVKNNAMPYSDDEVAQLEDLKKFNQTRHFDPELNITTYLDSGDSRSLSTKLYEARQAGNYKELTEPGAPQNLNIVAGSAPKEAYNIEGTRMIADGDIKAMYQRYLGRDFRIDAEDTVYLPEGPKGIKQSEIDYWENSAIQNNFTYDDVLDHIKGSAEASQNVDRGKLFYNTNAGKEAEIRGKLTAEPAPLNPPNLTIRKVTVKRPDNIDSGWQVPGV